MKDRIKVWYKPNAETRPVILETDNTLGALQNLVGGYIETIRVAVDAALIVNEEGLLRGLPYNITFCGAQLVGPVVMVGIEGDEFTDLPEAAVKSLMRGGE